MRALVTGGAGFIGSSVVDALVDRGDEVVVVDDLSRGRRANLERVADRVELVEGDIRGGAVRDAIGRARPEVIFHLAAQIDVRASVADPARDADVNVLGTIAIAEAARLSGTRKIVFTSSGGSIYGAPDDLPVAGVGADQPPVPVRGVQGRGRAVPERLLAAPRAAGHAPRARQRLRSTAGPARGGRRRRDLRPGHAQRPTHQSVRGRWQQPGLRLRRRRRPGVPAGRRGLGATGTRYNVGTGVQTTDLALHSLVARATGARDEPEFAPARLGDLRASAIDAARARPRSRLASAGAPGAGHHRNGRVLPPPSALSGC